LRELASQSEEGRAVFDKALDIGQRAILGGRFRIAFSASAPFNEVLFKLFMAMGIRVSNGYGLTETVNSVMYNNNLKLKVLFLPAGVLNSFALLVMTRSILRH
jgi:long-subunit acyl-CoA synthetase (AMP-forming)